MSNQGLRPQLLNEIVPLRGARVAAAECSTAVLDVGLILLVLYSQATKITQ